MFALFEAGIQVNCNISTPRFGCASRGANHVAPLRGAGGHQGRPYDVSYCLIFLSTTLAPRLNATTRTKRMRAASISALSYIGTESISP